jgi:hypothetical protein
MCASRSPSHETGTIHAVDEWLTQTSAALADEAGADPGDLVIDDETVAELLDLARIAAHDSGDRRNAPLLCFLLGRASNQASLERLARAVRRQP